MGAGGEVKARLHDRPGFERSFERALAGTTIDALAPSLPLLQGTLRLLERELVEPLDCTLGLVSVTGDGRFKRAMTPRLREWAIQAARPRHLPRPPSDWPLVTEVPALTAAVLDDWIRRALAEPSPVGTTTWWDQLGCDASRVRLPSDLAADAIELEGTNIRVPIERRPDGSGWAAGAAGPTHEPPLRLRIELRDEVMTLSLGFGWSLWTEPGSSGRALVDRVAGKLAALGWQDLGWEDEEVPAAGPPAETVQAGRIAIGEWIRSGANDAVALGWLFGDRTTRFLITLSDAHAVTRSELAGQLAFPFAGVAPLDGIAAPDPPLTFTDALIEHLPAGRPASELAPLGERALASIGAQVAGILAAAHATGTPILGIRPELIYLEDDGDGQPQVSGVAPRGPLFVASARAPSRGPSCYQLPYLGPEIFTGGAAQPSTDVFALCAALHHLGTGSHPFGTLAELPRLVARVQSGQPEPWPGGGGFGELLARGMARDVAARPTAAELAAAFDALASP